MKLNYLFLLSSIIYFSLNSYSLASENCYKVDFNKSKNENIKGYETCLKKIKIEEAPCPQNTNETCIKLDGINKSILVDTLEGIYKLENYDKIKSLKELNRIFFPSVKLDIPFQENNPKDGSFYLNITKKDFKSLKINYDSENNKNIDFYILYLLISIVVGFLIFIIITNIKYNKQIKQDLSKSNKNIIINHSILNKLMQTNNNDNLSKIINDIYYLNNIVKKLDPEHINSQLDSIVEAIVDIESKISQKNYAYQNTIKPNLSKEKIVENTITLEKDIVMNDYNFSNSKKDTILETYNSTKIKKDFSNFWSIYKKEHKLKLNERDLLTKDFARAELSEDNNGDFIVIKNDTDDFDIILSFDLTRINKEKENIIKHLFNFQGNYSNGEFEIKKTAKIENKNNTWVIKDKGTIYYI